MDSEQLAHAAEPEAFARYIAGLAQPQHHGHHADGSIETLREADYQDHHILIRTTYRIEVDGETVPVPLSLGNDGQLHCHSLPNYQFASAVDMVKRLIDAFPEDFPSHGEGEHPGGHDHHTTPRPRRKGGT